MAATDFTTTSLIEEIKRKVSAPDSQDLYDDADFCLAMTDVQRSEIVPYIISAVEGYFEDTYEFQTVANVTEYLLPQRAVGLKIVSLMKKDGTARDFLTQVTHKQLADLWWSSHHAYCIRGNYIEFAPGFNEVITLQMRYYRAPSELVPVSQAGKVLSIVGNVLTLDNAPTDWAANTVVDIHTGSAPFQKVLDDVSLTAVSGFDVTIPDASDVSVGDYVCYQYQCVIPQIPLELFPILTAYAGLQFLEGLASEREVDIQQKNYEKLKANLFQLITPRVVSTPKGVGPNAAYKYMRY